MKALLPMFTQKPFEKIIAIDVELFNFLQFVVLDVFLACCNFNPFRKKSVDQENTLNTLTRIRINYDWNETNRKT
jgi:hypothetical protein